MKIPNIQTRVTDNSDLKDILTIETLAFGQDNEAELTAALLNDDTAMPLLSMLAFRNDKAIGHILFTRGYINNKSDQPLIHILGPLAVIPEHQYQGVGGFLIKEGLKRLKDLGSEMIFVLGHMDYYPKYGFIPDATELGYPAPYPIPREFAKAWMVQSLKQGGHALKKGKVLCCKALDKPEYWKE